jgi:hypothetical protein
MRNPASGITQGRVICRLVSMFQSVDELVDEADRRRGLEAQGRLNDFHHSPEYVHIYSALHCIFEGPVILLHSANSAHSMNTSSLLNMFPLLEKNLSTSTSKSWLCTSVRCVTFSSL